MKLALVVLAIAARTAAAHPLDMGYLRVDGAGGEIATVLDIDITVAESILRVERLDAATAAARATELATATYRGAAPTVDGVACMWTTATAQVKGTTVSMSERVRCPTGEGFRWELPFVKRMASTFQVLARVRAFDQDRVFVLEKNQLTFELAAGSPAGFADSVWRGIAHGKPARSHSPTLPDGIDRIVFVLALMVAGSLLRILALAGLVAFAHAVGLGLASSGVVLPDPIYVFAPLLIGGVAGCALDRRFETLRWIVAAIAAVLYGLDAGAKAPGGSWIGFAIGVALSLFVLVLLIGPLAAIVNRRPRVARGAAIAFGVFSVLWIAQLLAFG